MFGRAARALERFRVAAIFGVAAVVLYGWVSLDPTVPDEVKGLFLELFAAALAVVMSAACARAALWSEGRMRVAWWLMAVTGALWAIAESLWFYLERFVVDYEDPSVADAFYLAAVVTAVASLLTFYPREQLRSERVRNLIAALVIGLSVLFVSRALILPPVIAENSEGQVLARVVYIAYPLTDVILASLALILLARVKSRARPFVMLLAGAFLFDAFADTVYGLEAAVGDYESGQFADIGWIAAYVLFILAPLAPAAVHATEANERRSAERADGFSSLIVYVPLLAAVVVAAWNGVARDDGMLYIIGIAVLLLFGLRQFLLARDTAQLLATLQRVDELEETSDALRRLARSTERTMQAVAEGVFGVDVDGRITFANPPAALMLGVEIDALTGTRARRLFYGTDTGKGVGHDGTIRRSLLTGKATQASSETFQRADGSTFPVELAVGPVLERGGTVGAVIVFRDVTERRQIERMKDEFISVVSHELRTPLTAIRGSLGLLASGKVDALPPRSSRLVGLALDSSVRLGRLVDDLLDIDRIESGGTTMEFSECDAPDLVRTAVDGVRNLAADVPVTLVVGDVSGRVHADGGRIVQTLTNLLGNAIKFSPPGTSITVAAAPGPDDVEFTVTDQGRGVPADKLETIFERFEQVDSSDSREKGGTGLGLAICRTIVRRHGGRIWARSDVGHGSTFAFTLPAVKDDQSEDETVETLEPVRYSALRPVIA